MAKERKPNISAEQLSVFKREYELTVVTRNE